MSEHDGAGGGTKAHEAAVLEAALGYSFCQGQLLTAAVTHRSYVNENFGSALEHNERLEFLGDAVVDLVIAEALMERLPSAREGRLSKLRASLVSEATLARAAAEIDLGRYLRLGRGEEQSGGRVKTSLLADALEALIGAVYLDGGLQRARAVIARLLSGALDEVLAGGADADFKTRLQELLQAQHLQPPVYAVAGHSGPEHAKVFEVTVSFGERLVACGSGRSKKEAEQAAAHAALRVLEAATSQDLPAEGAESDQDR